jgi:hypothetical protein
MKMSIPTLGFGILTLLAVAVLDITAQTQKPKPPEPHNMCHACDCNRPADKCVNICNTPDHCPMRCTQQCDPARQCPLDPNHAMPPKEKL